MTTTALICRPCSKCAEWKREVRYFQAKNKELVRENEKLRDAIASERIAAASKEQRRVQREV